MKKLCFFFIKITKCVCVGNFHCFHWKNDVNFCNFKEIEETQKRTALNCEI